MTARVLLGLGTALRRMWAERSWDTAAVGGTVLDRWPTIAPNLTGKVAAERYDDETQTLHLRPISHAYCTQLTLHQRQIVRQINAAVGDDTVRSLEILAPGTVDAPQPATPAAPRTQAPTVQPRPGHPGYLAAHHASGGTRDTGLAPRIPDPDPAAT
ncbi:DciA family protein [Streptomyces sp. NPDC002476]|uniref:DciA family protein n=1 Tax=Streptomyces sp. NPDC002476 TaxID=3364648 RepID=UPI0036B93063